MSKFTTALQLPRWSTPSLGINIPIELPPEVADSAARLFWPGSISAL
jgi:hypothetical protein